jgi:uncharacterized protein YwbE
VDIQIIGRFLERDQSAFAPHGIKFRLESL